MATDAPIGAAVPPSISTARGAPEPSAKSARVAVIIPAFNEAAVIGGVVASLPRDRVERIIVVDGPSTDGTADIARRAGAEILRVGPGYGRACLAGAQAADTADILVFMDGDGADDPAVIDDLVAPIRDGRLDFVIGSRLRGEREKGSMAGHQILAGLGAGLLIKLLYGVLYTDMSAYRAIRRQALLTLRMRELTYGWNLEMQMRAARAGLRVLEVPVPYRRRAGGRSKVSGDLRGSIKASARIIATFFRVALEREPRG